MMRRNRHRKPYRIEIEQHGVIRNTTLAHVLYEFPQAMDAIMGAGLGETITIADDGGAISFTRFLPEG